jgi:hypothetical protein
MEGLELSRHCIPWTPFRGRIEEAQVCLVSSAGVRLRTDAPFDPSGDTSYRSIPGEAAAGDLAYDDEHYDHTCADADLNCIFPLERLRELAAEGAIGGVTRRHFSYGFTTKLRVLKEETFPKLVKEVESVHPDVVLLTGG